MKNLSLKYKLIIVMMASYLFIGIIDGQVTIYDLAGAALPALIALIAVFIKVIITQLAYLRDIEKQFKELKIKVDKLNQQ